MSAVHSNADAVCLVAVFVGGSGARAFVVGLATGVGVQLPLLLAALRNGGDSVGS